MANLEPVNSFDDVPQLEENTVALGGPDGPMNAQAQALLNRTAYLKGVYDALVLMIGAQEGGGIAPLVDGKIPVDFLPDLGDGSGIVVVNNIESNSAENALSANMGRVLYQLYSELSAGAVSSASLRYQTGLIDTDYTLLPEDFTDGGRKIFAIGGGGVPITITIHESSLVDVPPGSSLHIFNDAGGESSIVTAEPGDGVTVTFLGNGDFTKPFEGKTIIVQSASTVRIAGAQ